MPNEPRGFAQPMAWWGVVQGAVRERATTAEIWQSIRDFGARNDLTYPPGFFAEVNRIRSQAATLRNASDRLGRAASGDAITDRMLAPLPYSRSSVEQALAQQYHVRVGYTARRGAETEQSYITLSYTGSLPGTVGSCTRTPRLRPAPPWTPTAAS
jgi:hypothetical protein